LSEKDKILIVEDEKDTRFILNKLLTKNDYEVETTSNGKEALEKIKTFMPKVILADWTMPVMDGIELCNHIKSSEDTKLIYYIILTARSSLNDKIRGLDIGADDFLSKPIENQELLARIRTGIRVHNLQAELRSVEHSKAIVEMACTIGHEINNPLSSLIVSLKNLEDELKSTPQHKFDDDLTIITKSIERIKILVNNLVNLKNPEVINYTDNQKMIKLG
jgi:sigma-B regulation protein RsbU (phosphoserine phosphatase)